MEATVSGLVVLDGGDQSDRPLLEEVAKRDAAQLSGLSRLDDQVEVVLDQRPVRRIALHPPRGKEPLFLRVGQSWITRDLRPDLVLLVLRRLRFHALSHLPILRTTGP